MHSRLGELQFAGVVDVHISGKTGVRLLQEGKTTIAVDWKPAERIESTLSHASRQARQESNTVSVMYCRLVAFKSGHPLMNLDAPGGPTPYMDVGSTPDSSLITCLT
jgi:hypothetical protein